MHRDSEYFKYINGDEWKATRIKKLHRLQTCQMCSGKKGLEVHHKHYRNFTQESMDDLVVLCKRCHKLLHNSKPGNLSIGEHTNEVVSFWARCGSPHPKRIQIQKNKTTRDAKGKPIRTPQDKPPDRPWMETSAPVVQTDEQKRLQEIKDRSFALAFAKRKSL